MRGRQFVLPGMLPVSRILNSALDCCIPLFSVCILKFNIVYNFNKDIFS